MHGRRTLIWLTLAAALGLGVAAGVVVLRRAPAAERPPAPPTVLRATPSSVAADEQHLTPEARRVLLGWAARLSRCAARRGPTLDSPVAHGNEIVLPLPAGSGETARTLRLDLLACAERLGGPPAGASLTFKPGARLYRLYKPKTCLVQRSSKGTR